MTKLESTQTKLESAQSSQADLIQKLVNRIEELEKKDAAQAAASEKAHGEVVQRLMGQISGLEEKVKALEDGRVLPEISVAPADGPTVESVDQKIRILERKSELAAETAAAKAKEAPRVSIGQNGFAFSSGDTNFTLKVRGLVQLDSRTFTDDNALSQGNDSFLLRRARPIIEGTFYRDFDFAIVPEFGGNNTSLLDAYANYRFAPGLQLRAGRFKTPVGLEQLLSDSGLPFNERSLVSNLLPNRNVGLQLWGELGDGAFSYAAGLFNGAGDNRNANNSDFDDAKEAAARVFVQPFKHTDWTGLQGLGFGVGGSYSQVSSNALGLPNTTGGSLPGYATDGQQQFFAYNPLNGVVVADGPQWRLSPQFTYLQGPFGLLSEYAVSHQQVYSSGTLRHADLTHAGWQVTGQWVLTGEPASFSGIAPRRPFGLEGGGWGAWQLVARVGQLDIDDDAFLGFSNPDTSASEARSWSVGVNWWLNRNFRVLLSYSRTEFEGGGAYSPSVPGTQVPPATVTAQDEGVFFTRIQLSF